MIRTISKIPKDYTTKEYFLDTLQEDAVEFMDFLLKYNPWEPFMTVHETRRFLVNDISDATSFECIKDVDDPNVYPLIHIQKTSEYQGDVVKLKDLVQYKIVEQYPDDYRNEGATNIMLKQIEREKKKGAKLYKVAHVIGCEGNKSDEDQLPKRLLITKRCHNGTEQLQAYYNEKL